MCYTAEKSGEKNDSKQMQNKTGQDRQTHPKVLDLQGNSVLISTDWPCLGLRSKDVKRKLKKDNKEDQKKIIEQNFSFQFFDININLC